MPTTRRRALVIGVDRYPLLEARYQLQGCVNDANLMHDVLTESFGFDTGDVRVLRNEEASREAILRELDALVAATGEDDLVVVHYSGHGSQMTDRENDEPDGRDETIMPSDSGRAPHPNRDITDDEIFLRLVELGKRTRYTTLVFDCCHSATITRDPFGVQERHVDPDLRPIGELPASPIPPGQFLDDYRVARHRDLGPSGWLPPHERYVLIAGCRDEESSYEHRHTDGGEVVVNGALTFYLAGELRNAAPGTSYRDVFEHVASLVSGENPRQHPQMEGALDRELFGVRDVAPMRFVRVVARAGDRVTLAIGAAHGATAGSRWHVYPQGAKREEEGERLGEVEIERVGAVTSETCVLSEPSPGAIGTNARAVEAVHTYHAPRITVEVADEGPGAPAEHAAARPALVEALGTSGIVMPPAPGTPAQARVYLLPPRDGAAPGAPVPQLHTIREPAWAAVGENGALAFPPQRLGDPGAVREGLERVARYDYALGLTNRVPSRLRGKINVALLRQAPNGAWEVAAPDPAYGLPVYDEGARIGLRVTNRTEEPVHLGVLDFGVTTAVAPVHPIAGAEDMLSPGRTIEIGARDGEVELTVTVPPQYRDLESRPDVAVLARQETLKLFATTAPTSFAYLAQAAMDGLLDEAYDVRTRGKAEEARGGAPSLVELLRLALGGAVRDVVVKAATKAEDWTTVERPFRLRRARAM